MNRPPDARERFDRFVTEAREQPETPLAAQNKAVVSRYFDMWNTGDATVADRVLDPTYFDHAHPETLGPAAFRSLVPRFQRLGPETRMTIAIMAADEQFVAVRNTIAFRHDGASTVTEGVALFRVAAGKLVEQWSWYPRNEVDDAAQWLTFRA